MRSELMLSWALATAACKPEEVPQEVEEAHSAYCDDAIQAAALNKNTVLNVLGLGVSGFPEVPATYEANLNEDLSGRLELATQPSNKLQDWGIENIHCYAYNTVNEGWSIRTDVLDLTEEGVDSKGQSIWTILVEQLPTDSEQISVYCQTEAPTYEANLSFPSNQAGNEVFFDQLGSERYSGSIQLIRGGKPNADGSSENLIENGFDVHVCN